jgi:hypothetical protein
MLNHTEALNCVQRTTTIDARLCQLIEAYRADYLDFFLKEFEKHHRPQYKGAYANINSVTGLHYDHHHCYSWTDGRTLGELSALSLASPGLPASVKAYADHLSGVLMERYQLNGWFPHVVDDATNLAVDHPTNARVKPGESSFSHVFVLNGLFQYGLALNDETAVTLASHLLGDLEQSLSEDTFIEELTIHPAGERVQGPFMISLGAIADVLETLACLRRRGLGVQQQHAKPLLSLGRKCLKYIIGNHYRPEDHAFWEVNQDGQPSCANQGCVVTDPGHTMEFTGFAARFSAFVEPAEREKMLQICRHIFRWVARKGFHPARDLVYKSVDRDTGTPLLNETAGDISCVVSAEILERHFGGQGQAASVSTFPWWVPMELLAAGSILRHGDQTGEIDEFLLRAAKGIFRYYPNPRIGGLCYQNVGDGFFDYIDIPPATPTLDLMHSHRSMRVFLREVGLSCSC